MIYIKQDATTVVRLPYTITEDYILAVFTKECYTHYEVFTNSVCGDTNTITIVEPTDIDFEKRGVWAVTFYEQSDYSNIDPDNATLLGSMTAKVVENTETPEPTGGFTEEEALVLFYTKTQIDNLTIDEGTL